MGEADFVNSRGQRLATFEFPAENGKPLAVLIWHHGLGEHCERYSKFFFDRLNRAGIAIHTFDCLGHGKSEPTDKRSRAYFDRYEDLVDDCIAFEQLVSKRYDGDMPFFLGGQSMGGFVAAHVVLRQSRKWAGVILTSPAIDVDRTLILRIQEPLGNLLANWLPHAQVVPAINVNDLSPDPQVVKDYCDDPLNFHGMVKARVANELLKGFAVLAANTSEYKLSMLAIHGDADKITSFQATKRFMTKVASKDRTFVEVPRGYHELLMGPEKDEMVRIIVDWILKHSPNHKL